MMHHQRRDFFHEKSLILHRENAMLAVHILNDEFNAFFLIRIVVSGVQTRGVSCQ